MMSRWIGAVAGIAVAVVMSGCALLGREYEYEEQVYLNTDGSATVIIDSSLPALVALHGIAINPSQSALVDRVKLRQILTEGGCHVVRIPEPWRRHGRRFIQIRLAVDDVRDLPKCVLTSWSTYSGLQPQPDGSFRYEQTMGAPAGGDPGDVNWTGEEIVGIKLHLPSRVLAHNARSLDGTGAGAPERGNILTWEETLAQRRSGIPIAIDVRMDRQSILERTLVLFVGAFVAALLTFGLVIWAIRRPRRPPA